MVKCKSTDGSKLVEKVDSGVYSEPTATELSERFLGRNNRSRIVSNY